MNIVIVGCGRVGARLATQLDQDGHDVAIVDSQRWSFLRLRSEFSGRSIVGTGIDEDVLRSAGVDSADAFIAVTNWDNTNLMAAQIARSVFGIERVAARVYDPVRAEIFGQMGIPTISPTITISTILLDTVLSRSASG